ncbi:MAG: TonB-dependent receptor [Balneolales bacterium]
MRLLRTIVVVLLVVMVSVESHAGERGTVYGMLSDAGSGAALIAATIKVTDEGGVSRYLTTNSRGLYEINLEPGVHTLIYSYLGYETLKKEIEIKIGEAVNLDVGLYRADAMLAELVVETSTMQDTGQPGRMQVPVQYMNNTASLLHSDIFRSIQLMPGVLAASDFSSGLHIRGGSPDQTLILLDGATVYNPTHFYGFFSTFNPDVVDNVTLHKGAYPANYGGRMGSVVDVRNQQGSREGIGGGMSLGLLSSRAMVEGPYPGGTFLVAYRRSNLEPTLSVLRKTEESIPDSFHFYDLNASVSIHAGKNNRLNLTAYNSLDHLSFPISGVEQFNLDYGNQAAGLNWVHIYSNSLFSTFSLSASRYTNSPAFDFAHKLVHKDNTVADYSARADFEWIPGPRSRLLAGIGAGQVDFGLNEQADDRQTFASDIRNNYANAYLQARQRVFRSWEINAGVRGNWYSEGDYLRLEPRLSVDYNLTSSSRLRAAAGRYYQFASLITSESFSGFDIWLSTADLVPPSYSNQFSLGYSNVIRRNYEIQVEGYYRSMHDLFQLNPFAGSLTGRAYEELFYFEEGYAAGLEFFLTKHTGTLNGYVSYTLGATRKRNPEVNNNRYYPPKYDRLNDLSVVGNVNLSPNWKITSVFSYGSGQPYTRPLGRTVLSDEMEAAVLHPMVIGRVNAARLPAYHRLDLGISRTDKLFGQFDSELKLEVINVYSRRNVWFYHYRFSENPIIREEATMLPLIPSLTYSISF